MKVLKNAKHAQTIALFVLIRQPYNALNAKKDFIMMMLICYAYNVVIIANSVLMMKNVINVLLVM